MSINASIRVGDTAIGASLLSRGERTQDGVDTAHRSLSDALHDGVSDDARRLDRPGALDALVAKPGPLARFER